MRNSAAFALCIALAAALGPAPANAQRAGDPALQDFEAASAAMKRGDWDAAVALYGRSIGSGRLSQPNLSAAYGNRCLAYNQKQQFALAKLDCDRSLAITPDNYKTLHARGIALVGSKQNDAAQADFSRVIALLSGPNENTARSVLAEALFRRAVLFAQQRRLAEALADLNRSIALDSTARSLAARAVVHEGLRNHAAALADIDRAIALAPGDAGAYRQRARLKQAMCGQECALADYSKTIELDPRDTEAYRNRAYIHREAGRWSAAAADYTKLIELQPNGIDGYFGRGGAYLRLGQLDKALPDLEKGAALKPNDPATYSYRASTYFLAGYFDRAVEDYSRAIQMKPGETVYYEARAQVNISRRRYQEALDDVDRALQLDPASQYAVLYRARALAGLGRGEAALAEFARARALPKVAVLAMVYRGDLLVALGRYDEAVAGYSEAARRWPAWSSLYNARGVARLLGGDAAGAIEDLRRATELAPRDALYAVNHYVVSERAGRKGWADLARAASAFDLTAWPGSLASYALGNLDAARLLATADHADPGTKRSRACAAHFVIGAVALSKGDKALSAESLRQSVDLCAKTGPYGVWAASDLKRLGETK